MLEEYEDSGTTQKKDVKKTPAKMLPSTKHCMCTICNLVVMTTTSKFEMGKLKIKIEYQYLAS